MKKLILLSLLVCRTLCYAQADDPFGLYKNPSSFSTSQKETTSNSETFEKEKKELLLEKIAKLEAKLSDCEEKEVYKELSKFKKVNLSLESQINNLQKSNKELKTQVSNLRKENLELLKEHPDDRLKKINKQLLEQIKGLQIELCEIKEKKWK